MWDENILFRSIRLSQWSNYDLIVSAYFTKYREKYNKKNTDSRRLFACLANARHAISIQLFRLLAYKSSLLSANFDRSSTQ